MIDWKQQGAALVGEVSFINDAQGTVVLVADRSNLKGATVIVPGRDPQNPEMRSFPEMAEMLPPAAVIDVMVRQERQFGTANLPSGR